MKSIITVTNNLTDAGSCFLCSEIKITFKCVSLFCRKKKMRSNQTQDELEGFGVPTTKSIYANRNPVSLTFNFLPVLIPVIFLFQF